LFFPPKLLFKLELPKLFQLSNSDTTDNFHARCSDSSTRSVPVSLAAFLISRHLPFFSNPNPSSAIPKEAEADSILDIGH
jgi:hypothetical protein